MNMAAWGHSETSMGWAGGGPSHPTQGQRSIWSSPSQGSGNSQWNGGGSNNQGRGGPRSSGWQGQQPPNHPGHGPRGAGFNSAPGSMPRPPTVGAWNNENPPVVPAATPSPSVFAPPGQPAGKVNPNNIWNIPTHGASDGNSGGAETPGPVPVPSAIGGAGPVAGGANSVAGSSTNDNGDSFTNIGTWESSDNKDRDPDADPKGTRLWAAYLMQSRHMEDKTMGGKLRSPNFAGLEEMSDDERKHLVERIINSHDGWGKTVINQETSWETTMNFIRSDSISSDRTASDNNPPSPASLNDPNNFPAITKPDSAAQTPLSAPPTSAKDSGWGSSSSTQGDNPNLPQGDDGGLSVWCNKPPVTPSTSSATHASWGKASQPISPPGNDPPQSPNAWEKPLKPPTTQATPIGDGDGWSADPATVGGEISAAITTTASSTWGDKPPGDSADSWNMAQRASAVPPINPSDVWGITTPVIPDDAKSRDVLPNDARSHHSSRVPSPSLLDRDDDAMFNSFMPPAPGKQSIPGVFPPSPLGLLPPGAASKVSSSNRSSLMSGLNPGVGGGSRSSGSSHGMMSQSSHQQAMAAAAAQHGAKSGSGSGSSGQLSQANYQQAMHQLELANRAQLLPPQTILHRDMPIQYLQLLQQYAQHKFNQQKLRAQLPIMCNQLQHNQSNPHLQRQYQELTTSISNLEINLSKLAVLCAECQKTIAMKQMSQQSNLFPGPGSGGSHSSGSLSHGLNDMSLNSGGQSRLSSWLSNNGSSGSAPGSTPGSSGLDDNVFPDMNPGSNNYNNNLLNAMQYGKMDKSGMGMGKGFGGPPEFVPGQQWKGAREFGADVDSAPGSNPNWGMNSITDKEIHNLTSKIANMSTAQAFGGPSPDLKQNWGFDGGSGDLWRQPQNPRSGHGNSQKWGGSGYGNPGAAHPMGSGNWGGSGRNQSTPSFHYPSGANLSPQRPHGGGGSSSGGSFRPPGSSNSSQSGMYGGWNNSGMFGGGSGGFDPAGGLMPQPGGNNFGSGAHFGGFSGGYPGDLDPN